MSFSQLLAQHFVHTALLAGAIAAAVSGAIGLFVVIRGMSFAVHAVSELGFTGAAGALALGISPVAGIFAGSLAVGAVLGLLTVQGRERDSAIGSFLAFGLGIGRPADLPLPGFRGPGLRHPVREHHERDRTPRS